MAIELNAALLKRAVEHELASRLVKWQKGYVDRRVAECLSEMIVEVMFETALRGHEDGIERAILDGLKMIRSWQD